MSGYFLLSIIASCVFLVLSFFIPYVAALTLYFIVIVFGIVHSSHQLKKTGDGYVKTVYPEIYIKYMEIYKKYIESINKNLWIKSVDIRPQPIASFLAYNRIDLSDLDIGITEKYTSERNIRNLKKDGKLYTKYIVFSVGAMFPVMIVAAIANPAYW
jgi:hypothetical protein